jgi:hypothetical protein
LKTLSEEMNIDRHNYEEYFILYWDNELTNEQKQLVKQFVQQNTDLEDEFNLLGQTHFSPDENISLPNKEFLIKEEYANRQELFLSYIDNELNAIEKSAVEKFIAVDPPAQRELALLQKTKLQPENIVFPDKSKLYRREEKKRIVRMVWFRVAAAAAIILVGSLITVQLLNKNPLTGEPVVTAMQNTGKTKFKIEPEIKSSGINTAETLRTGSEEQNEIIADKKKTNTATGNQSAVVQLPKRNKPQSLVDNNNLPETNPTEIKVPNNSVAKTETNKSNDNFINNSVTPKTTPTFNDQNSNSGVQFASNNKDDKGGLRGLLRKATRVFERRTNIQTTTEDNKLLVGAFAVSLK